MATWCCCDVCCQLIYTFLALLSNQRRQVSIQCVQNSISDARKPKSPLIPVNCLVSFFIHHLSSLVMMILAPSQSIMCLSLWQWKKMLDWSCSCSTFCFAAVTVTKQKSKFENQDVNQLTTHDSEITWPSEKDCRKWTVCVKRLTNEEQIDFFQPMELVIAKITWLVLLHV